MTDDQSNYLCNDDDLNSLTDYFTAALASEESKSRLQQMWEQEIGVIKATRRADNPVPNSKELTLLAQTDWHNREERKHRYEMIPWTMGWMNGFLSERKPYWPKVHEAAIRRDEREKYLSLTIDRISKERGEILQFIRSYCISTNCTNDCGPCKLSRVIGILDQDPKLFFESLRSPAPAKEHDNK